MSWHVEVISSSLILFDVVDIASVVKKPFVCFSFCLSNTLFIAMFACDEINDILSVTIYRSINFCFEISCCSFDNFTSDRIWTGETGGSDTLLVTILYSSRPCVGRWNSSFD